MISVQFSVTKSNTLSRTRKRLFYMMFSTVAVSCLCEWIGVLLQGAGPSTRMLHVIVKAVELSLAPTIAVWYGWIIERRWSRMICSFVALNAVLEIVSGFFGFIYSVDADSFYTHEEFYWIYVAAYLVSIVYFVYIMICNLKKYQYNGGVYGVSMVAVMLLGIYMQMSNSELRVIYITMALVAVMGYVFSLEMIQQTDELTELLNRRGYENCMLHLDEECVIIFFDVDHFKSINDTFGHAFGDAVLRTVGKTILKHYARFGKCFRYGGDEFCVIQTRDLTRTAELNRSFWSDLQAQRLQMKDLPSVSIGYVYFDPGNNNIQDAVAEADQMMYKYKQAHRDAAESLTDGSAAEKAQEAAGKNEAENAG